MFFSKRAHKQKGGCLDPPGSATVEGLQAGAKCEITLLSEWFIANKLSLSPVMLCLMHQMKNICVLT